MWCDGADLSNDMQVVKSEASRIRDVSELSRPTNAPPVLSMALPWWQVVSALLGSAARQRCGRQRPGDERQPQYFALQLFAEAATKNSVAMRAMQHGSHRRSAAPVIPPPCRLQHVPSARLIQGVEARQGRAWAGLCLSRLMASARLIISGGRAAIAARYTCCFVYLITASSDCHLPRRFICSQVR